MEDSWLYTKEALEHTQEATHERAAQVLRERRTRSAVPKPLCLAEGTQLVVFYARKLPELCKLCAAPPEVTWTALVFFKRFFAVSSPMEFDPMAMMYTCVHLACKIEECREVTLDQLLEVSGFSDDATMKCKVADLELELLEGLGFSLLVEPKPSGALRVLAEEHRRFSKESLENVEELLSRAEALVLELCVGTWAVLLFPSSMIFAAAWGATLEEGTSSSYSVVDMLAQNFKDRADKEAVSRIFQEVRQCISSQMHVEEKASMQEIAKTARKCQRAFGIVHEERKERHEAHRKERKRRRNDLKGLPVGIEELKRKAQALLGPEDARMEE